MAETTPSQCQRILFLGDGGAGKTCLIQRFLHDRFSDIHRSTVEDIYHRSYLINNIYSLQVEIIDTSGTYVFPEMRRLRIAKATGFVLVSSLTDLGSLERLRHIVDQIRELREASSSGATASESIGRHRLPPLVIAANKLDCKMEREISDVDLTQWMTKVGLDPDQLVLTSAKEDDGVWSLFASLWKQYRSTLKPHSDPRNGPVDSQTQLPASSILNRLRRFSAYAILSQGLDPCSVIIPGSKGGSLSSDSGILTPTDQSDFPTKIKKTQARKSVGQSTSQNVHPRRVFQVDCTIS